MGRRKPKEICKGQVQIKGVNQKIAEALGDNYRGSISKLDGVSPDDDREILDTPILVFNLDYELAYAFDQRTDVAEPKVKEISFTLSDRFSAEVIEPISEIIKNFVVKYEGVSLCEEKISAGVQPYDKYLTQTCIDDLLSGIMRKDN